MKLSLIPKAALVLLALAAGAWVQAAGPAPPTNLIAEDYPWDSGGEISVTWNPSVDEATQVAFYKVYRSMTDVEISKMKNDTRVGAVNNAKLAVTEQKLSDAKQKGLDPNDPQFLDHLRKSREIAAEDALEKLITEQDSQQEKTIYKFLSVVLPGNNAIGVDNLKRGVGYSFKILAIDHNGEESVPVFTASAVKPIRQGFDGGRFFLGIIILAICGSVVYFIQVARSGQTLKVRKIAGLEAVDEAVGRATEMGRSILFVPGIQDINDIQTIAGLTCLSRVAKTAAEYDAKLEVPTARSLVMTVAREAVQASYTSVGRPDAFNQDLIYYVTDEQFGYVAYLSGMMVREKPAACFYMGAFFAESLILAETGNSIGAIQVAGTAMPAQLPFFVAACDYTLIGEEFFAASAYLSGEPDQLGSLKGQDVGKLIVGIIMIVGIGMLTLATIIGSDSGFGTSLLEAVRFLKEVILT